MPYELTWYVEKRVIFQRLYGEITFSELRQMSDEANALVRSGTRFVHLLVDLQEVTKYPTNVKDASGVINMEPGDNLGWTLVVTPNTVLRFLGSMMGQLARQRVNTFRTWEDALQFLSSRDDSIKLNELPPLPIPNRD
jgi:hypothetical protein